MQALIHVEQDHQSKLLRRASCPCGYKGDITWGGGIDLAQLLHRGGASKTRIGCSLNRCHRLDILLPTQISMKSHRGGAMHPS